MLGRSATDPEGAWRAMEPSTNDILRDRGLALQAIACVDVAIGTSSGVPLGLPLHRVWGSLTDTLPIERHRQRVGEAPPHAMQGQAEGTPEQVPGSTTIDAGDGLECQSTVAAGCRFW